MRYLERSGIDELGFDLAETAVTFDGSLFLVQLGRFEDGEDSCPIMAAGPAVD